MSAATPHRAGQAPGNQGPNLDDILFTLFRHKWLLVGCVALAIAGAAAVRVLRPPPYISTAKLMVHYVSETRGAAPGKDGDNVRQLDASAQAIINSEIEILTSLDVAAAVADRVGPAKILARKGGGDNRLSAASVVCSGIEVDPPRSSILTVSFKHQDETVVQPVLEALVDVYMRKHLEVHQRLGIMDDHLSRQRDELRRKLGQTEEDLKRLKTEANVLFLDETKKAYQSQIARLQDSLLDAEREMAERKAMLGAFGVDSGNLTNALTASVPAEQLTDFSYVTSELDDLRKRERELLRAHTAAHPLVQTVQAQIAKLQAQKRELEERFPSLREYVGTTRSSTNVNGNDVAIELAEMKKLVARVAILGQSLATIKAEAVRILDAEPRINELTRQREEEEKIYQLVLNSIGERQMGEAGMSGKVFNMSVVQNPTPPGVEYKKLFKLLAIVVAGCLGLGLGLAFVIDFVFDRSLKRTSDVERHLHLPVLLSIPDTAWNDGLKFWRRPGRGSGRRRGGVVPDDAGSRAVAKYDPRSNMQTYAEGLRERIITYFDVRDMNAKKPKMVGVTGCGQGSGVSTLATGLAVELSKTGEGNVLLVDMHGDQGVSHPYYKGQPGCGLSEVLEPENRAEAQVQENLYVVSLEAAPEGAVGGKLPMVLPKRFTHLMPKLQASDYDYVIFDMPPVNQTSATPRLAGYMDIVLLVLEAEKTGQQSATRAAALMKESRANVAAVLNKCRQHVPSPLSQEM